MTGGSHMQVQTKRLQSNSAAPTHIFSIQKNMGGDRLERIQEEVEQKVIHKQLEGKFGQINILKPTRQMNITDEDINSLIARILFAEQKRKATD